MTLRLTTDEPSLELCSLATERTQEPRYLFPAWEYYVPNVGIIHSLPGNKCLAPLSASFYILLVSCKPVMHVLEAVVNVKDAVIQTTCIVRIDDVVKHLLPSSAMTKIQI